MALRRAFLVTGKRLMAGRRLGAASWLLALFLAGCSGPVGLYHSIEGGAIAQERQAPPGADLPYPNLADVPAAPGGRAHPMAQALIAARVASTAHRRFRRLRPRLWPGCAARRPAASAQRPRPASARRRLHRRASPAAGGRRNRARAAQPAAGAARFPSRFGGAALARSADRSAPSPRRAARRICWSAALATARPCTLALARARRLADPAHRRRRAARDKSCRHAGTVLAALCNWYIRRRQPSHPTEGTRASSCPKNSTASAACPLMSLPR